MGVDLNRVTRGKVVRPPRVVIYGFDGVGKAQPLDARVLTPHGFVAMGSIEVGDDVVGGDGRPVGVVGVYPQGKKKVFRVVMKDGAETECCEEHLWATNTITESLTGKPYVVRSLADIRENFLYRRGSDNPRMPNDYPNHRVPVTRPVEFRSSATKLPLHPYLLGLLLGDGGLTGESVIFTKPELDVMDRLATLVPEADTVTRFDSNGMECLRIRRNVRNNTPSETRTALQGLGLMRLSSLEKFIPDEYLFASVEDRIELLRGIADTDGYVIKSGQRVEISTSSPHLRDGIMFLVRSLGGVVTLQEKSPTYMYNGARRVGATAWRMLAAFPHGLCPVSSQKHLAKWRTEQTAHYQSITEVEEVGEKECRCIKVDSEDGLYLTDDFIVTHNTSAAAGAPNVLFLDANKGSLNLDVARVFVESWDETFDWLEAIENEEVKCDNVVLDSVSDFERMSHARLFPGTTISKYEGGYNKGDDVAVMEWQRLLYHLERLWMRGKGIILVAHATVKKFEDPTGPGYERFELATRKPLAHLLRGWSDYVLFARENVTISGKKNEAVKAATTGERWLWTRRTPAYDAKARGTALFPERIPLSWDAFAQAIREDGARGEEMRRDLGTMLAAIGDKAYEKQVLDWVKQYPGGLVDAFNRVQIRLNDKKVVAEDGEKKPAAA